MSSADEILAHAMDHHRRGQVAKAESGYRDTLKLDPENADALHLLGTIIAQHGDTAQGIDLISRALAQNPESKEAHINLGNIFAGALRMTEAEHHFREAYQRDRTNTDAANGLGGVLMHLGRYTEAEYFLREALSSTPDSAPALINMGTLMEATARFEDAIGYYERVLARHPDHASAHAHRSLAFLLRGRFQEGWAEYGWRYTNLPTFFGRFPFPYWHGEPLSGRKILVWTELGPGDEILASTMIPDLIAAGAIVILLCSPRMAPIFARSFPSVHVLPAGRSPLDPSITADIAFQASLGDLGAALRRSFNDFPDEPMHLKADPERAVLLRRRYMNAQPGNMLIGISWRSRNAKIEDAKSVPLEYWAPILNHTGVTFVSLQYGDSTEEVARARRDAGTPIFVDHDVDPLADMDSFVAQVAAMDLVISVSNTTLHVAGALGIPVWAMIPSNHGRLWYWFLERSDSPWYPSARLFRQDVASGWQPAVAAIAENLRHFQPNTGRRAKTDPPAD